MIAIAARVEGKETSDFLKRLAQEMQAAKQDLVIERAAFMVQKQAVLDTIAAIYDNAKKARWNIEKPENHWVVVKAATAVWWVQNSNKAMIFIDRGTVGHGPRFARVLYVPLARRAAGGWRRGFKFGVDYILTKFVKGIRAYDVSGPLRRKAKDILLEQMKIFVRNAITRAKNRG